MRGKPCGPRFALRLGVGILSRDHDAEPLLEVLPERGTLPRHRLGVPCCIVGAGHRGEFVRRGVRLGRGQGLYLKVRMTTP